MTPVHEESRSQVVQRHVTRYLNETRTSMESFAADVASHYCSATPAAVRDIRFHSGGDAYKDMRANGQLVRRFLEGNPRMPVDIEESMVGALPVDRRAALVGDLAARYGLLAAPIPVPGRSATACSAGRLMKETGEAIEAIASLLDDDVIDDRDRPQARHVLQQINEAMAELVAFRDRITAVLPDFNGPALRQVK